MEIEDNLTFDPVAYINTPRWSQVSLGLHRTQELLAKLGNPQNEVAFVHIAGTNGKGSTCAFAAQGLQNAGYKVGLFTSPYLICFEERIRINGENISLDRLREVTLEVREIAEAMEEHPTEFELMTAVAFLYFAQEHCDIVVAEVGLGGRLDSTNVILPIVCAITPIALDHIGILGDTLEKIAREKAGIIKQDIPVISAVQEPEVVAVFEEVSSEKGAPFSMVNSSSLQGNSWSFSYISTRGVLYKNCKLSLLGSYQISNAALAIELLETLNSQGIKVPQEAIENALKNTKWPGRFELVHKQPDVIIDGGHNVQGAHALIDSLDSLYPNQKVTFVFGVLEDKQYQDMISILTTHAKRFICFAPPNPRALSAEKLGACIQKYMKEAKIQDVHVQTCSSVTQAVKTSFNYADEKEVLCFCGSLYSIGEIQHNLDELGYTTKR